MIKNVLVIPLLFASTYAFADFNLRGNQAKQFINLTENTLATDYPQGNTVYSGAICPKQWWDTTPSVQGCTDPVLVVCNATTSECKFFFQKP
ncbi:MAG: hypothetical protein ACXVCP_02175 [Bdellovibrio sp.]